MHLRLWCLDAPCLSRSRGSTTDAQRQTSRLAILNSLAPTRSQFTPLKKSFDCSGVVSSRCVADHGSAGAQASHSAQGEQPGEAPRLPRRHVTGGLLLSLLASQSWAQPAHSATLDTALPGAAFLAGLWEAVVTPPDAVRFPRKPLDLRFAVLLMRSSYDAVDDLDFVPMDEFQKLFWKFRASEQESYKMLYDPLNMRIGDLSDPLYFDFVSFSQYATISRAMRNGKQRFEERCEECDGDEKRLVVRDAQYADDSQLPDNFRRLTADRIYSGLRDGFRGKDFGGPPPCSSSDSFSECTARVQSILDIFVREGYCLKADVREAAESGGGGRFTVHVEGPATLWGVGALASRRALAINNFDALAVDGFLRASGRVATYSMARSDTATDTSWTLL